jgi:mannose-6-phosphate isomerase
MPTSLQAESRPIDAIGEPLFLTPVIQDKLWGGDGLWRYLRKGEASQTHAGESWELSDRPEASSTIASGRFEGLSLNHLMAQAGPVILGSQWQGSTEKSTSNKGAQAAFPLLYKFIYAREALSVQVHPGEGSAEYRTRYGEAKTECWLVVAAPENAEIIVGVSQSLPREAMAKALASSACREVLRREKVKAGDLLFIPAGTVHAITEGLLIYELQQNSDTTFRLYDWDRLDAAGKPRELHVQKAAEVMDLRVHDRHKIMALRMPDPEGSACRIDARVACSYFALWHCHTFTRPYKLRMPRRMRVATVLRGDFSVEWPGHAVKLGLGETVLLPADLPEVLFAPQGEGCELLVSAIPDLENEINAPLRQAGHSAAAIAALGGQG